MSKRPISITIICWFLLITSAMSGISTGLNLGNPQVIEFMQLSPVPVVLQVLLIAVGLLVTVTSAVWMLQGKVIGRSVLVAWVAFSMAVSLLTSPDKQMVLPGLVFFVVVAFFLYRPVARAYFSQNENQDNEA